MILVNRLYTVISAVLVILVTVFYLIYMSKGENKEYVLYLQNNTSYNLQTTNSTFIPIYTFDVTTSSYNTNFNVSRIYLDAYNKRTGRFVAIFSSSPSDISFNVINDRNDILTKFTSQLPPAYYPISIEFHAEKTDEWVELQYRTSQNSNNLYKLSVEFY